MKTKIFSYITFSPCYLPVQKLFSLFCLMCSKLVTFPVALGEIILPNHARSHICFKWTFQKMATAPQEMKVKTLQGDVIAVEVVPTNTVKELRAMLLESKECECPIERQLLRVEVLTAGLLVDDETRRWSPLGCYVRNRM